MTWTSGFLKSVAVVEFISNWTGRAGGSPPRWRRWGIKGGPPTPVSLGKHLLQSGFVDGWLWGHPPIWVVEARGRRAGGRVRGAFVVPCVAPFPTWSMLINCNSPGMGSPGREIVPNGERNCPRIADSKWGQSVPLKETGTWNVWISRETVLAHCPRFADSGCSRQGTSIQSGDTNMCCASHPDVGSKDRLMAFGHRHLAVGESTAPATGHARPRCVQRPPSDEGFIF